MISAPFKTVFFLSLLLCGQSAWAQCDALFAEPEFGVENEWVPKVKGYVPSVDFKEACANRSACYLSKGSFRSQCDRTYHDELMQSCELTHRYDIKFLRKCRRKADAAAEFVGLNGGAYFRAQQRKLEAIEREEARKERAAKRREGFESRAKERKERRLGR